MNSAKLRNSPRLQRTVKALRDAVRSARTPDEEWLTTRDVIRRADVCAVSAVVSELRDNGCVVESDPPCKGRPWWRYRLVHEPDWRSPPPSDRPVAAEPGQQNLF